MNIESQISYLQDKALIEAKLNKELIEVNEKGMQLDNKVYFKYHLCVNSPSSTRGF